MSRILKLLGGYVTCEFIQGWNIKAHLGEGSQYHIVLDFLPIWEVNISIRLLFSFTVFKDIMLISFAFYNAKILLICKWNLILVYVHERCFSFNMKILPLKQTLCLLALLSYKCSPTINEEQSLENLFIWIMALKLEIISISFWPMHKYLRFVF